MILLDKPFTVGQFISVGSTTATVEKIGVRSTHLRSLRGEIVVMNNSALTNSTVLNFADMVTRRMIYSLGVTYSTSVDQMKAIPGWVEQIIEATPNASFSRCHFTEFGDSSQTSRSSITSTPATTPQPWMHSSGEPGNHGMFCPGGVDFAFPSRTLYWRATPSLASGPEARRTNPVQPHTTQHQQSSESSGNHRNRPLGPNPGLTATQLHPVRLAAVLAKHGGRTTPLILNPKRPGSSTRHRNCHNGEKKGPWLRPLPFQGGVHPPLTPPRRIQEL